MFEILKNHKISVKFTKYFKLSTNYEQYIHIITSETIITIIIFLNLVVTCYNLNILNFNNKLVITKNIQKNNQRIVKKKNVM